MEENRMVPEPSLIREAKVVDDLAEKRKSAEAKYKSIHLEMARSREDLFKIDEKERIRRIKQRAEHLEKEATQFETYIKNVAS